MAKKYSKKKQKEKKGKNASNPGYRTPAALKGKSRFDKKSINKRNKNNKKNLEKGFNPGNFKIQHKG